MTHADIRPAATMILWRHLEAPEVLMGRRKTGAVFMPGKMVFPGGAVDAADARVALAHGIDPVCRARLEDASDVAPDALAVAAIRETWEETGLRVGRQAPWRDPPDAWREFAAAGVRPDAGPLRFVFRAVTPPGRPRRFDARFFLAHVDCVAGDAEAFTGDGELADVQWVALDRLDDFDLPFVTRVVLAEIAHGLDRHAPPARVPFFASASGDAFFRWLGEGPAAPQ